MLTQMNTDPTEILHCRNNPLWGLQKEKDSVGSCRNPACENCTEWHAHYVNYVDCCFAPPGDGCDDYEENKSCRCSRLTFHEWNNGTPCIHLAEAAEPVAAAVAAVVAESVAAKTAV